MKAVVLSFVWVFVCCISIKAQDSDILMGKFIRRYAEDITKKADGVEAGLNKQSQKHCNDCKSSSYPAYAALHRLDSNAAKAFLQNSRQHYDAMLQKLKNKSSNLQQPFRSYVPGLDSASCALKYIDGLTKANVPG